ncbi:MAG: GNAT family N-acetyltransferase [Gemmatimonadaceae bacterium]
MLEGQSDVVLMWDLRVSPAFRDSGVGRELFLAASQSGQTNDCRTLRVETQDVNVAAVRFYLRQGCALMSAKSDAYADAPGEVKLIFEKELART